MGKPWILRGEPAGKSYNFLVVITSAKQHGFIRNDLDVDSE